MRALRRLSWLSFVALPVVMLACSSFGEVREGDVPVAGDGGGMTMEGGPGSDGGQQPDATDAAATTSTLSQGLIARWRFDDTSGTVAKNDVASAPAGTLTKITFAGGKLGGAFMFDGTASRVTVASSPSLAVTTAFTIALWAKLGPSVSSNDQRFFATSPIDFKLNNRYPQIGIAGSTAKSTYVFPEGEWHHVAASFDSGVPRIYVDGVEVTVSSAKLSVTAVPAQIAPLYIGAYGDGYGVANGLLDDVRMWNRALTAPEVLELSKEQ